MGFTCSHLKLIKSPPLQPLKCGPWHKAAENGDGHRSFVTAERVLFLDLSDYNSMSLFFMYNYD